MIVDIYSTQELPPDDRLGPVDAKDVHRIYEAYEWRKNQPTPPSIVQTVTVI
jgi:hypothetical protein